NPGMAVIMMTAHSSIETAVAAIRGGIYDYLTKPVDPAVLLSKLDQAIDQLQLRRAASGDSGGIAQSAAGNLVGHSMAIRRVRSLINSIGPSDMAVLISGETGSGKEI